MGDWQPSAVGSKAFSCSGKIESVLVMIPRHLFHSDFSDSFPLWIAFPSVLCPSEGQGLAEWAEGGHPETGIWGGPLCPRNTVSGGTREGTDPWPFSSPRAGTSSHASILTLDFPAVCQGWLPVSWSLRALGSASRRGSREAAPQWKRAGAFTESCPFVGKPSLPLYPSQQ